jgi:hypothetical protein
MARRRRAIEPTEEELARIEEQRLANREAVAAVPAARPEVKPTVARGLYELMSNRLVYGNKGDLVSLPLDGATVALLTAGHIQPVTIDAVHATAEPAEVEAEAETEMEASDG